MFMTCWAAQENFIIHLRVPIKLFLKIFCRPACYLLWHLSVVSDSRAFNFHSLFQKCSVNLYLTSRCPHAIIKTSLTVSALTTRKEKPCLGKFLQLVMRLILPYLMGENNDFTSIYQLLFLSFPIHLVTKVHIHVFKKINLGFLFLHNIST